MPARLLGVSKAFGRDRKRFSPRPEHERFFPMSDRRQPPLQPAPYVGTSPRVVQGMLRQAEVQPGELVADLGAGDGRILLAAVRDFGARAIGVERDPALLERARAAIDESGLSEHITLVEGEMTALDLREVDVVTLFLNTLSNALIAPKLREELKPGARVISYLFPLQDWEGEKRFDPPGSLMYLYRIPT